MHFKHGLHSHIRYQDASEYFRAVDCLQLDADSIQATSGCVTPRPPLDAVYKQKQKSEASIADTLCSPAEIPAVF